MAELLVQSGEGEGRGLYTGAAQHLEVWSKMHAEGVCTSA